MHPYILLREEGLSDRHSSFRKARSTMDAKGMVMAIEKDAISAKRWLVGDKEYCAIITLDVKTYSTLRIGMPRWLS